MARWCCVDRRGAERHREQQLEVGDAMSLGFRCEEGRRSLEDLALLLQPCVFATKSAQPLVGHPVVALREILEGSPGAWGFRASLATAVLARLDYPATPAV